MIEHQQEVMRTVKGINKLVDEGDEAVFADSAYQSEASEAFLLDKNCQNFILFKVTGNHPLSEEENLTKNMRSCIRVRCEHVFGRMSQMAMHRFRTIGLVRANQHTAISNLIYNMDRYAFLCRRSTKKGGERLYKTGQFHTFSLISVKKPFINPIQNPTI